MLMTLYADKLFKHRVLTWCLLIPNLHVLTVFSRAIPDLYWLQIVQCDIQKMPFQTESDHQNKNNFFLL